jgi:hypothetical protein
MIQGEAWVDRGAAAQDAYRLMLRHHIAPELRELGFRRVASGDRDAERSLPGR